jgi:hypothetical protein
MQCPDPNNPRINMLIQSIGAAIPATQAAWFCEVAVSALKNGASCRKWILSCPQPFPNNDCVMV